MKAEARAGTRYREPVPVGYITPLTAAFGSCDVLLLPSSGWPRRFFLFRAGVRVASIGLGWLLTGWDAVWWRHLVGNGLAVLGCLLFYQYH